MNSFMVQRKDDGIQVVCWKESAGRVVKVFRGVVFSLCASFENANEYRNSDP